MQAAAGHNHPLEQNLRRTLLAQPLLDPGSRVLVGVSGGADSMAVIAATSAVDTGFVMAMQLARFLVVLVAGPAVTRRMAQGSAQAGPPPL